MGFHQDLIIKINVPDTPFDGLHIGIQRLIGNLGTSSKELNFFIRFQEPQILDQVGGNFEFSSGQRFGNSFVLFMGNGNSSG